MLVRGTLGRLAGAKTTARDLPQLARFLHRTLLARNASELPAARALTRALASVLEARRCYATTTSATTPTATVKKAVKAKAASKAAPRKSATTKTGKTPAKKSAATKAKPKTKAKAKTRATTKKPAPKKRVRKVLTPEEKEKAKIAELRKIALREPVTHGAVTAYSQFVTVNLKGKKELATTLMRDLAPKFKELTPAEREHYNHLAAETTAAKRAEYQAWIHTYTPEQINAANNARAQLRLKLKGQRKAGAPKHTLKLVDDRHVKRPSTAYVVFFKERHLSGDFKGIAPQEATKLVASEWKALSAGEKKKYEDEAAASKAEYERAQAATP